MSYLRMSPLQDFLKIYGKCRGKGCLRAGVAGGRNRKKKVISEGMERKGKVLVSDYSQNYFSLVWIMLPRLQKATEHFTLRTVSHPLPKTLI